MTTPQLENLFWSAFNGFIFAHEKETGIVVWKQTLSRSGMSVGVVADGQHVFAGSNGYFYCLNATTGKVIWENLMRGEGTGVTSLVLSRLRPASIDDPNWTLSELLWVGFNNKVCALRRDDGSLVWKHKLENGGHIIQLMLDGTAIFASCNGYFSCLEAITGERHWFNPMKGCGLGITSMSSPTATTQADGVRLAAVVAAQQAS